MLNTFNILFLKTPLLDSFVIMNLILQSLKTKAIRGCLALCRRPTRCTYLFCSSSFSCRSWPISERIPRSVLERELIWLRSSCSTCLLACRSAFNFLMSCSSLGEGKEQHLRHWGGTPGALRETLAEVLEGWLDGGASRHHCNSCPQSAFECFCLGPHAFPPEGNFCFSSSICELRQVKMVTCIWAANKGRGQSRGRVAEGEGPLPTGELRMLLRQEISSQQPAQDPPALRHPDRSESTLWDSLPPWAKKTSVWDKLLKLLSSLLNDAHTCGDCDRRAHQTQQQWKREQITWAMNHKKTPSVKRSLSLQFFTPVWSIFFKTVIVSF